MSSQPSQQGFSAERPLRLVSLGLLTSPAIIAFLIFYLTRPGFSFATEPPQATFTPAFYALFVAALALLFYTQNVKNMFWKIRSKNITTKEQFNGALFTSTILSMAFYEAIAMIGLVVFNLTHHAVFGYLMCAVALAGMLGCYPSKMYIEERKRQTPQAGL